MTYEITLKTKVNACCERDAQIKASELAKQYGLDIDYVAEDKLPF